MAKTSKVPAPLAKTVAANAVARRARLAEDARADIALIHRKQEEIVDAFWDVGQALVRLKRPGVAESLGRKGFADLVARDLDMALSKAEDLMAVAERVPRPKALRWGPDKSAAVAELVDATSDPALVTRKTMRLGSGKRLDFEHGTAAEIRGAAKEIRQAKHGQKRPRRGVTTTAEERAWAARVQSMARKAGLSRARVYAVARAGRGADMRIEGVPIEERTAFAGVLAAKARG